MFIRFHHYSNGKLILVPIHAIKFIIDREDGGTSIHTTLILADADKQKTFRSKESAEEIFRSSKKDIHVSDGIFSNL